MFSASSAVSTSGSSCITKRSISHTACATLVSASCTCRNASRPMRAKQGDRARLGAGAGFCVGASAAAAYTGSSATGLCGIGRCPQRLSPGTCSTPRSRPGCSSSCAKVSRVDSESSLLEEREGRLASLRSQVAACRRCAIGYTRTQAVCGVGSPRSPLVIVGEGPGENEDRQGEPFVGRAGELLNKMLAAIDVRREDVYITNTIKSRATIEEGGRIFNRAPTPDEMANCREYLDRELQIIQPRIILALGAPAAKSFLGRDFSITRQRGIWYAGPNGADLMVTFHPAYILRLTGGNMNAVKQLVWSDLLAVRGKLDQIAAEGELKEPHTDDSAAPAEATAL